jgi:hypothetical protein
MPRTQVFLDDSSDHRLGWRAVTRHRRAALLAALAVSIAGVAGLTAATAALTVAGATTRPVATATTVRAATDRAGAGATGVVELAATETAANGIHPAGYFQFEAAGTDVGSAVPVNSNGVATTMALAAADSADLSATFTPTSAAYSGSASSYAATLLGADPVAGVVQLTVTVPPAGSLIVTVAATTVPLTVQVGPTQTTATGTLSDITVTDGRNWRPGWSVSGQESVFVAGSGGGGQFISGSRLGWTPTGTVTGGARLGPAVAPGHPGLGMGSALALADVGAGYGTDTLSANLVLDLPTAAAASSLTGTLTITFLEAGP